MPTDVEVCNRALQMVGARTNIQSLTEDTEEAANCNMLLASVRDQILGMAPWGFARTTVRLDLIKAAPGTAENTITGATEWISSFPTPPWFYTYRYPVNCLHFRYLVSQSGALGTPIFSGQQSFLTTGAPSERFAIGRELTGPLAFITGITKANPPVITTLPAHSFANGETVLLTSIVGMTELNNRQYTISNVTTFTFTLNGVSSTTYGTYSEGGLAVNRSQAQVAINVILTNAVRPLGSYIAQATDLSVWEPNAVQALVSALAGFLARPLTGNLQLSRMLLTEANMAVLQARIVDANQSLTVMDWTPDWLATRGGLVTDTPGFNSSYSPLFAVS